MNCTAGDWLNWIFCGVLLNCCTELQDDTAEWMADVRFCDALYDVVVMIVITGDSGRVRTSWPSMFDDTCIARGF